MLDEIENLEHSGFRQAEILPHLKTLRQFFSHSPLFKRMQVWPRGYPGDFETIEYIMKGSNNAPAESIAYQIEQYALTSPAAQQHRNKVIRQAQLMLETSQQKTSARILSLACGGCPDLRLVKDFISNDSTFLLADYDQAALNYSKLALKGIKGDLSFLKANALKINREIKGYETFDLILIGGLFDYLKYKTIIRILNYAWSSLLSPGGKIFFTNISNMVCDRIFMEYLSNWVLISRDEEDIVRICQQAEIPKEAINIERDTTNCTLLVTLQKT